MQHRHLLPELCPELAQQMGRQPNLRHQHHGLLALCQYVVDELDIDGGLAAAGDAVEQGAAGAAQHLTDAVIGGLLLLVQLRRQGRLYRCAVHQAIALLAGQGHNAFGLHGTQGAQLDPSEIADVLHRRHRILVQKGGRRLLLFGTGADDFHSLLQRHGQLRHQLGLIPHASGNAGLQGHDLRFHQLPQDGGRRGGAHGLIQLRPLHGSAVGEQGVQHLPFPLGLTGGGVGRLWGDASRYDIPVAEGEVQPRREHGPHGLVDAAKVTLPHPQSQLDALPVQHRPVVQHRQDALAPGRQGLLLLQSQHQPLRMPVAPAEGDEHPLSGRDLLGEHVGDLIGVGLVNGDVGGGDGEIFASSMSFITPPPLDTDKGKRPILSGRLPPPLI